VRRYRLVEAREQGELPCSPYDSWAGAEDKPAALFFRLPKGYLVRFPDQADFAIDAEAGDVTCTPTPDIAPDVPDSLFHNAIIPLIGNHNGGLFLHGSAVSVSGKAIGFLAPSRRGKTTLAGAFAKQGHAFLTEDVLELRRDGLSYMVQPSRPVLRLFDDSAIYLLGVEASDGTQEKRVMAADNALPFEAEVRQLSALFLLGSGTSKQAHIEPLAQAAALGELMQHAFVLNVEDKQRLRGHFDRLGELVERLPFFALDFPRDYAQLPAVVKHIVQHVEAMHAKG
jgi:hypothetical protein